MWVSGSSKPAQNSKEVSMISNQLLMCTWRENFVVYWRVCLVVSGLRKIALPFKVIWQFWTLLWTLTFGKHYDYLLLQNPPAVPAMVVCWLYCLFSSTRFVVDWHNYGYSILALSLGSHHRFVSIYRFIERKFCQNAHAHLCVTKAMKDDLMNNWNIK